MVHHIRMFTVSLLVTASAFQLCAAETSSPLVTVIDVLPTSSTAAGRAVMQKLVSLGPDGIEELFSRVQPPSSGINDVKERCAVQQLASHVSRPGANREQQLFSAALLKKLHESDDSDVRIFLMEQLEFGGNRKDAAELIRYLSDPKLVHSAARAVLRLDRATAEKEFPRALEAASPETRVNLLQALGSTKSPAVVKLSAPYANDGDPNTRYAALVALADTGSPEAAQYMPQLPADPTAHPGSKELSILLNYARRLSETGHKQEAEKIVRPIAQLPAQEKREHVQAAALSCLVQILGPRAQADLEKAMGSPAYEIRAAALKLGHKLKGESQTQSWIRLMKTAEPEIRAEIIAMLGERGDKSAGGALVASLADAAEIVKLAAIPALVKLMGEASVAPLLKHMQSASDNELKAARTALAVLSDKKVNAAVASASRTAPSPARVALLETLAARGAADQMDTILAAAQDSDASVRVAALKAAENIARPADIPRLVELLLSTGDAAERTAARKAIVTAGRKIPDAAERLKPLTDAWGRATAEKKTVLLDTAANLGGEPAFKLLAESARGTDETLRDTAVRLLGEWPDRTAAPTLLDIAKSSVNETQNVLALRGYLRLAGVKGVPPDEQLTMYRNALEAAKRADEKKLAIAAAGGIETTAALEFVSQHLDDADLKEEAAQSVSRIVVPAADGDPALSGTAAAEALKKSVDILKDRNAVRKARARLVKLQWKDQAGKPTPAEDGFAALFNGKDLDGWIGDTSGHKVEAGVIVCDIGTTGNLFTKDEYGDFHLKLEFRLTPAANNGIAVRSPLEGTPAFEGMEIQVMDDGHEKWKGLQPWQYTGSIYGVAAPTNVKLKPVGEWNALEVIAQGDHIESVLNGEEILDARVDALASKPTVDGTPHPGLTRRSGYIGFCGHGDRVEFRNVVICDYGNGIGKAE